MKAEHSEKFPTQSAEQYLPSPRGVSCEVTGTDKNVAAKEEFNASSGNAPKSILTPNDVLDDIPDLAAYMDVQSPPTPPTMNDLTEVSLDNIHSVDLDNNLDPASFLNAESDGFQQNCNKSSYLGQLYMEGTRPVSPDSATMQPHCDGSLGQFCLTGTQMMNRLLPRKRTGNSDSIEDNTAVQRPEPKAKNKRRRRRNACSNTSQSDSTQEIWMNTKSPGGANGGDNVYSLDASQDCFSNEGLRSELTSSEQKNSVTSPVVKRRASGSVGTPSPIAVMSQRNDRFVEKSPQKVGSEHNFPQNQVFVFSSKLANQAAESIKYGRHANIIEYHRSLPTTVKVLSNLSQNQSPSSGNSRPPTTDSWYVAGQAGCSTVKDSEMLTPEQLKKRQENLAKLQGIGQLLNVYPQGNNDNGGRTVQMGPRSVRPPCSMMPAGPRMYRLGGPLSPSVAARREMIFGANSPMTGHSVSHMARCGGPYMDSYIECPSMMSCPGTPSSVCSSSAQLDWQRLQAEFYEKRAKEQQLGTLVRMPNGSALQHNNGSSGRRMILMKANQPERFCSAVDFLRRTSCPQNAFSSGCEMQMCPSPKQMNYEIDGQELIITKQLNSSRVQSRHTDHLQTGSNALPSGRVSTPPTSCNSELAQPLSSMLQMTNSIPQPCTSPNVNSSSNQQTGNQQSNQRNTNESQGSFGTTSPPISQKNSICSASTAESSCSSAKLSAAVAKTTVSGQYSNEYRRSLPNYDVLRGNPVMYKCQPSVASRHCYNTSDGGYYFDDLGQEPPLLVPGNASSGGVCQPPVAAMHNGHPHGPPSVNNTYVNATMSIQQLNIQSVQPGLQGGQHGSQQPIYGQQHAMPSHAHSQFMNNQHHNLPGAYVSVNGSGFDEMNQNSLVHRSPMTGMMQQGPPVMIMRGQQPHMAPRIISRTVRYDPGYNIPSQHIMMPTRPEYMGARIMTTANQGPMHHDMCAYGMNHSRVGPVNKKPIAMSGNMMMSADCYRERMMLHHQAAGSGTYMMTAMNSGVDNQHQMISMMSVNSGATGGIDPSLMTYNPNNGMSMMMMDSNAVQQLDEVTQRKGMEMMDPVSARLAEAGMMFTTDPLETSISGNSSAKQFCDGGGEFMLDNGQFLDSSSLSQRNAGTDRSRNGPTHQMVPSMYNNNSCKDEVL